MNLADTVRFCYFFQIFSKKHKAQPSTENNLHGKEYKKKSMTAIYSFCIIYKHSINTAFNQC